MAKKDLATLSVQELVSLYEGIVLAQDESFKFAEIRLFNQQYGEREDIANELRSRPSDQREMRVETLRFWRSAPIAGAPKMDCFATLEIMVKWGF